MEESPASPSVGVPAASVPLHLLLLLGWSAFLLFFFTEGDGFPAWWHADEAGKVWQIVSHNENFHHPLLLLQATKVVLWLTGGSSPQQVIVAGRWVSAIAAVVAIDLLVILAASYGGLLAGYLTALMVGTNPLLFGLAHYMKEDLVYLFGIAAFLLALASYGGKPVTRRLILLGAAAGLTVSGKYLGAIVFPIMIGEICWKFRGGSRWRPIAVSLAAAGLVFALINFDALVGFNDARWALEGELTHVLTDHYGFVRPLNSPLYLQGLVEIGTPIVLGGYLWWLVLLVRNRRSWSSARIVISLLPIFYIVVLQISPVKIIPYELPSIVLITMIAACCLALLLAQRARPLIRSSTAAAVLLILLFNGWEISRTRAALLSDTRGQMAEWIFAHLDVHSVLLEDQTGGMRNYVSGESDETIVPISVVLLDPAEMWTVDRARAAGITHVLLSDQNFGRYFNSTLRAASEDPVASVEVDRMRAFYRDIFARGTLLYHLRGATPVGTYFSPGLWLFSIETDRTDGEAVARPPKFRMLED